MRKKFDIKKKSNDEYSFKIANSQILYTYNWDSIFPVKEAHAFDEFNEEFAHEQFISSIKESEEE